MLTPDDVLVVIRSRHRSDSCRRAAALQPDAPIYIAEEEWDAYAWAGTRRVTHPNDVIGIGPVTRAMLKHFPQRCVVTLDDDVKSVWCLVGRRSRKITDPDAIRQVIYQAAVVADELGVSVFGFANTPNLLDFIPQEPFGQVRAPGPCQGYIGRKIQPDQTLHHMTDSDLTLQCLLKDRIVWQDNRFAFEHSFQSNVGGAVYTAAEHIAYLDLMKRRWGTQGLYWDVVDSGGRRRTVVRVKRRQSLEF